MMPITNLPDHTASATCPSAHEESRRLRHGATRQDLVGQTRCPCGKFYRDRVYRGKFYRGRHTQFEVASSDLLE